MSLSISEKTALDVIRQVKLSGDWSSIIEAIPYAGTLGVKLDVLAGEPEARWQFELPPSRSNIGNHTLPALHGGAIAGFMEVSAALQLLGAAKQVCLPRVIDFSIDYLRPGRLETTWAECTVERLGRRTANVSIRAWQTDKTKLIAIARAHFLLDEVEK